LLAAVLSLCKEAMEKPHSEREDLEYLRIIIQEFQENLSDEEEVKSSLSDLSTQSDI
jgi:hypothetical protein